MLDNKCQIYIQIFFVRCQTLPGYKREEGVAFKLAMLDKRRLCRFEFRTICEGSFVPGRYNRSISSRVFPCVSGTMKITKNTDTKQMKENNQKTPYAPR